MSFPVAVDTTTVQAGPGFNVFGESTQRTVTVRPYFGGANQIIWEATGEAFDRVTASASSIGELIEFDVPFVDQDGWIDGAGNTITMWAYEAQITATDPNNSRNVQTWRKMFQPVTADGATFVLDQVPDSTDGSPVLPAVLVPIPGETGPPGGSDAAQAAWIADEGSLTRGALDATIDAALEDYVPLGGNIVTDPGFELGDYSALTNRFSVLASNAHAGTKALRVAVGDGASQLFLVASTAVTAGQVWRVKCWYKTSSDFAGEAKVRLSDSANTPKAVAYFVRSAAYREIELDYVVPDGFSGPLSVHIHGLHSVGTVYVDDLQVRQVDPTMSEPLYGMSPDLLQPGQAQAAAAARVLRSSIEERVALTADGRKKTTLLNGGSSTEQPNASFVVSGCTVTDDTARKFPGYTQTKKVTVTGSGTSTLYRDPVFPVPAADPLTFAAASMVGLLVWCDDPTKLTSIEVEISVVAGGEKWTRATNAAEMTAAGYTMKYGWNYFRFRATASTITTWGSVERVRLIVTTSAATTFYLQELWVESPPKPQILFIEDRGYKTFVDNGLAALRTRGLNITWALDPLTHGLFPGTKNEVITDADVATFYAAGDDISIHAYDGSVTSDMSAPRLLWDQLSAQKWLSDRGYQRGHLWRAAFTQNLAANASVVQPYVAAHATPLDNSGNEIWPFFNRYNVLRVGLQGRTTVFIDDLFTKLSKTNGLLVCYTHGIHTDGLTNGGADMTPTEWTYFLGKVDTFLAAGGEFVTFSQLLARSGGVLRA